jgi:cytochrome c-type biogenesis protein CcmH
MMMVTFIILSALVCSIVLGLVLRPLWRAAPISTAALAGLLLLAAAGLYRLLGTPAALHPQPVHAPATLQDAITQLQAALQRDPKQAEGWRLLGRAYASNKQPMQARDAYAHAAKLLPDQPDVLVEAAEASALADPQHRFDTQAVALLQHALQVQPQEQRARWFLGISERQAGNPSGAATTWEPLLAQVDARTAAPLRAQINAARSEAGLTPLPAVVTASADGTLSVHVTLDPALAARVDAGASVFVIARVPNGPPMPVAVEKHSAKELPFTATLDDGDGPMPMQKISALQDVEVIARLSSSGNAMPQPGDLESSPVHVHLPTAHAVEVTIGTVHR